MNNFTTVISSSINSLVRTIKILRYGKSDIQTPSEILPYGLDSNPIKDMIALYCPTDEKGQTAIIGYINKNQKAKPGEFRTFATDKDGVEKFYTWMKDDGTMEIGGDTNFAVLFNELKTEFNKLKKSHNDFLTEYQTHIHSGGTISGSTGPTVSTQLPNASNIDNAKNTKIKTNS
jgi:hypothetical protein